MPKGIEVKGILNKTKRRDPWFLDDYTINLYSACSFNCLFCYIRGSKYGEHMQRSVRVKSNAIELLDKQLANRAKKGQFGYIILCSATDPYLHFEEELQMTRQALQVILRHRFPVHMLTRADLIVRDQDLLKEIDRAAILPEELKQKPGRGALITFSFSTLDDAVAAIFEPGATPPTKRLQALESMKTAGLLTGASMMPLLPWISDTTASLDHMMKEFKRAGADFVLPATLTLFGNGPSDSKTLVFRAVEKHYPHLLKKYQRYFAESDYMPKKYNMAFNQKMDELCAAYALRRQIGS